MTVAQAIREMSDRIAKGDRQLIMRVTQIITLAGWKGHSRRATAAGRKEFADFGWQGFDIKVMSNYAKRTFYRELSEAEVAYAQKVYARNPQYLEQVIPLLEKGLLKEVESTFKF